MSTNEGSASNPSEEMSEEIALLRIHNELIKKECEDQRTITEEKTLLRDQESMNAFVHFIVGTWKIKSSTNVEEFLKLQNAGALQNVTFKHSTLTIYVPKNNLMNMTRHVGTTLVDEQQIPVGTTENGKLLYIWDDFIKIITEHSTEKIWLENEQLHVSNESNGVRCERIYEKLKVEKLFDEEEKEIEKKIQGFKEMAKIIMEHRKKKSEIMKNITGVWEKLEQKTDNDGYPENAPVTNEPRSRLILKYEDSKLWCQSFNSSNPPLEHLYEIGEESKKVFIESNSIIIIPKEEHKLKITMEHGILHIEEYRKDENYYKLSVYQRIARDGYYHEFLEVPKELKKIAKKFTGTYEPTWHNDDRLHMSFDLLKNPPTFTANSKTMTFGLSRDSLFYLFVKNGYIVQMNLDRWERVDEENSWEKSEKFVNMRRKYRMSLTYRVEKRSLLGLGKFFGGAEDERKRKIFEKNEKTTHCRMTVIS